MQRQELLLNKIKTDGKRLAAAIQEQADAAKSMASHIASLAETSIELGEGPEADARRAVVERARQLMEVMDVMDQDVRPACLEQLGNSVNKPVGQLCEEFPAYQQCVDKRTHYMLDMDAYGASCRRRGSSLGTRSRAAQGGTVHQGATQVHLLQRQTRGGPHAAGREQVRARGVPHLGVREMQEFQSSAKGCARRAGAGEAAPKQ